MRLQSMWLRAATITPIRLVLGVAWLLAAMAAGARTGPALVAWLLGAFGLAFAALNDPRARLLHRDPDPLPEGVEVELEPLWRHALASLFPSTFGLSLLAAIAIVPQPVLAAMLGGATAGLGIAGLFSLPTIERDVLVEPRSRAVYRR